MTITYKSATVNGYYIEICRDKYSVAYRVIMCNEYGQIIKSGYYADMPRAVRRFNDLKRAAK